MHALHLVANWPVDHVAAAVVTADGVEQVGDPERTYRLASLSKPITTWAIMVGTEEGIVDLDGELQHVKAPDGATLRHLLSHAAGFGFDGDQPVAPIERRRMYSNTGIERAADELAAAADMPFEQYLTEAVLQPLDMTATVLDGSPAHAIRSTIDDAARFVREMREPVLLAPETYREVIRPQFPGLAGIVPDVGRFDPCPWGLGVELRGDKSPHWTGRANSPATFGHFGGAGTMMWVDPLADVGVVALTDRRFDEWRDDVLRLWPEFSDAVLAETRGTTGAGG
jgi:CubicO group peptidase (beta-lactamase class C family)